ncbi:MAG: bifunctional phosphoribosylaminoimidazolecarboxamide formyltransferase/IMP cyclohydrolase, partial [Bdellovibrionota bacterium]
LQEKKNIRLLELSFEAGKPAKTPPGLSSWDVRRVAGGLLVQDWDRGDAAESEWKVVTKRAPTDDERRALLFAWKVSKHVKSNAIVFSKETQIAAVGAGQMSRVDSVRIAQLKAQIPLQGTVVASDAFFPFRDGLDECAKAGAKAVIQPGGSVRDEEVIQAANEHGLAMVFTGYRHFRH